MTEPNQYGGLTVSSRSRTSVKGMRLIGLLGTGFAIAVLLLPH